VSLRDIPRDLTHDGLAQLTSQKRRTRVCGTGLRDRPVLSKSEGGNGSILLKNSKMHSLYFLAKLNCDRQYAL